MMALLASVAGLSALAAVCWILVRLARRVRRRGIGGGLMGPLDEIYQPSAYQLRFETQAQEAQAAPTPATEAEGVRR